MPRPSKSMQKWGITWKNDDKCWWMGMDHPTNDRTLSCWMTRSWPSSPAMNDGEVFGVNWVKSEFEGLTNQVWDLRGFIIESRERFVDHFADISNQSRCLDGIVLSFRPSTDCNSVDPTWFQICCWRKLKDMLVQENHGCKAHDPTTVFKTLSKPNTSDGHEGIWVQGCRPAAPSLGSYWGAWDGFLSSKNARLVWLMLINVSCMIL